MNSIKLIGVLVVMWVGLGTSAHAQNRYFSDHENGLVVQFVGGGSEYVTSLGSGAMVTLDGRYDIGFSYDSLKSKGWVKVERNDYTARLGVAITRPDKSSNWGVDLWGAYTWMDYLGAFENTFGGTAWAAGADISLRVPESEDVRFIPTFGIGFLTVNSWDQIPDGTRFESSSEEVLLGIELSLVFFETVILAPQLTHVDSEIAWAIALGGAIH